MSRRTCTTQVKVAAIFTVFAVLLTAVTLAAPGWNDAQAQVDVGPPPNASACYGVADQAFGGDDGLSVINRFTGVTANIGANGTGTDGIESVAFGPGTILDPTLAQQVLYTFDETTFGYINLTTGLFTSLGLTAPAGFSDVDGMTWDPQLNVFWITNRIGGNGAADQVAAFDPFTGNAVAGPFSTGIANEPGWTNFAGLPYDDFDDIALDPTDFRLYAILNKGGTGGGLVELDKTTGAIINYVGLFTPIDAASDFDNDGITDDIEGLAFFNDGLLYGSTGANGPGLDNNRFFFIDLATGTTTWIADFTDYADYEGLACLTVEAFIDVEKGTAEPGATPEDADQGPGPTIVTPTVEWTYVITNESLSLGLQNVVLVDDQIAGVLFNQATGETQCAEGVILAPGETLAPLAFVTCTVTGTTIIGPYTNNATVTGQADPGDGLALIDLVDIDPSNYVGDPVQPDPPELAVVKTAVAGAGVDCTGVTPIDGDGDLVSVPANGIATFCVTVTNVGGSDATNVTVTDDNATPDDANDDFVVPGLDGLTLAAGESATGSFEAPVTSLTPVLNTVAAIGTDPNTGQPTNEPADTAQVVALGMPELAVVKTVVAGESDCAGVTPVPGADAITVELGDTVTFCVTVTNVGATAATNVTVTDDNLTPDDPADDVVVPGLDGLTLQAGDSATGALVMNPAVAGVNTVTATGTDPNTGEPTNEPNDPSEVLLLGPPELAVVKTVVAGESDCAGVTPVPGVDAITVELGDTVTFCVTVTNVGATAATNVTVTDDNLTPDDPADDVVITGLDGLTLEAGESATGALVLAGAVAGVNTVTATGTDPNTGEPTNEPNDPSEVLLLGPPELAVVKTVVAGESDCTDVVPVPGDDAITVELGDTVTFCVTVTNVGETAATNVTVTDDNLTPDDPADDVVVPGLDGLTLEAGESVTGAIVMNPAVAGVNTVTATGTDPNTGEPTNEPNDPSEVLLLGPPELAVVKTVVAGESDCADVVPVPGDDAITVEISDTVTFCVTVTNIGETAATNVTVTDDNLTPDDPADDVVVPGLDGITLEAGDSATGALVMNPAVAGVNTVTATGTDPNTGEPTNEPNDPSEVLLLGPPELAVVKTVVAGESDCADVVPVPGDDAITVELGDTVTFCVTVTNIGETAATNVTVTDDNLTPDDPADDVVVPGLDGITLEAGDSATGALVMTAAVAGVNTVTATGTDPNTGEPTNEPNDPSEVLLLGPPELAVVKTVVAGESDCTDVAPAPGDDAITVELGDTVTFCVTVTNVGETAATNVTVTDDNLTPDDPADDVVVPGLDGLTLEAGDSATGALVMTAAVAGVNTVTATGTDPNTGEPTNEPNDPSEVLLLGPPELAVVKTVVAGESDCADVVPVPGDDAITVEISDTVTFCVTVTNIGETAATNVTVTDDNLTPDDPADDVVVPGLDGITLEAGDSATGAIVMNPAVAGVNTVTATGTDPNTGEPTNEPNDPSEVLLLGLPELTVVKTVVAGEVDCTDVVPVPGDDAITVEINDTVTFCVTVTNIGETAATNVTVTDDNLTPDDPADDVVVPGLDGITLEAGDSATGALVMTAAVVGVNTVTATGTDPNTGEPTNEPNDPSEVLLLGPPELTVVKTVVAGESDCADVVPVPGVDAITVEINDTVTFCVTVTNIGETAATNVTVTDDNLTPDDPADDVVVPGLDGITLEAGDSATGALVMTAAVAGVNTVTATGTDPNTGEPTNEPNDPSEVLLLGPPELTVVKTVVAGESDCADVVPVPGDDAITVELGDTVTFCVTVTNVGETAATNVTVTDDNLTPDDPADDVVVPGLDGITLEAGDSATGALVMTAAVAGVNTVTATGTDPNTGEPTNEPNDPSEVLLLGPPELTVVKTVVAGESDCADVVPVPGDDIITVELGDTVTFCVTVTNVGETAATNVTVTDDNLTPDDPADDVVIAGLDGLTLEPGDSATGALVIATPGAGVNTATATGTDPNTGEPTNEPNDPAVVRLLGTPELAVVKTVVAGESDCTDVAPAPGDDAITVEINDTVTFCVTVSNVGETAATNVTVTDDNLTPDDPADDVVVPGLDGITLEPGDSATGAIVMNPAVAGVNTVTATGTDPNTGEPTNEPNDPSEVLLLGPPELAVVKTVVAGEVDCADVVPVPGDDALTAEINDTVTFCVTVTNIGETAATNVTVTDDNLTPDDPADDVVVPGLDGITLEAGESVTGAIVMNPAVAGVNTVTATGTDPNTGEPTNEPNDPSEVLLLGPPELTVVKTVVAGESDCTDVAPAPGDDAITAEINDTVTFCVTVTNIGETAATNVTVTDDNLTPDDPADDVVVPGLDGITLEAGDSATGAIVMNPAVAGVNTVTATGTDPNTGEPTNEPNDPSEVLLLGPPELAVVKTVVAGESDCTDVAPAPGDDAITVEINDTVTFCVTVTNIGETAATNVTVTDDNLTPDDPADDVVVPGLDGITLEAGESVTGAIVMNPAVAGVNTVTATGTDPNTGEPTNEPNDPSEVLLLGPPELTVVKTVVAGESDCTDVAPAPGDDALTAEINDTVTFCVTVTNIGETAATNVTVTDDNLTPDDPADDVVVPGLDGITLEAGESVTGAIVMNPAVAGVNTVTATGTDPNTGEPTNEPNDPSEVLLLGPPELTVVKTVVAGESDCTDVAPAPGDDALTAEINDTVTFCVTVTNIGETAATNVTVTDDNLTPDDPADDVVVPGLDGITLEAGESVTGAIVMNPAVAGVNTVTATGTDPNTGEPTNEPNDPSEVLLLGPPELTVVKTVVAGESDCTDVAPAPGDDAITVEINDTVTFCVTVTNIGETAATNVTVTDDNLTPDDPADDVVVPGLDGITLEPGDNATGAIVMNPAVAGVNTVTATGTDPNTGEPTNEPNDPSEVLLLGPPELTVVKTVVAGESDCTDVAPAPGDDAITVEINDTVTFCVTVTNIGETAATNVTATDDNLTPDDPADDVVVPGLDGITLEAGESVTGAINYTVVSQDELKNTVSATGTDPNTGEPTNEPTDPSSILPPQGNAELVVVKTSVVGADIDCSTVTPAPGGDFQEIEIGDTVTFCVTVSNIGDGPAADVVVIDDNFTPDDTTDDSPVNGLNGIDLAPGESATGAIVFEVTELEAKTNTVTATGTDTNSGGPTNEPSDPAVIVPFGTPILAIVKTAVIGADVDCSTITPAAGMDQVAVQVGDVVTYCIIVTNEGNGVAADVQVFDDNFTPADTSDDVIVAEAATLLPGETLIGSFTRTVTNATALENTAKVTAIDPITGTPTNEPTDPAVSISPAIDLTKQVLAGSDRPASDATEGVDELVIDETGSPITWVYTVTNSGSMPLIVTEIVDPSVGITVPIPAGQQLIAPGASVSVTANDVVTRAGAISEARVIGIPADSEGQPVAGFPELTATNDAGERPIIDDGGVFPRSIPREIVIITNPPPTRNLPPVTTTTRDVPPAPPLALTGSNTTVFATLAAAALWLGGMFTIVGRRRREDQE